MLWKHVETEIYCFLQKQHRNKSNPNDQMTAKTYEQQMAVGYLLFLHCVSVDLCFSLSFIEIAENTYIVINEGSKSFLYSLPLSYASRLLTLALEFLNLNVQGR